MRTKSPGSTKGMGYITPSKQVGRLMLNFMMPCASPRAAASAAAMDGASSAPPMITSSRPKARYSSSLAFTWAGVPQAAWRRTTSSLTRRSTSVQFSAA